MKYILIIDDDKWYSESIANMIKGYEIKITNSSEEAIRIIDKNIPYLIYLDLKLGTKNGLTILNELQSWNDTRVIPIVLLTDDKRLDINDWEKYGVVGILDKSEITLDKLKESLMYGKPSD